MGIRETRFLAESHLPRARWRPPKSAGVSTEFASPLVTQEISSTDMDSVATQAIFTGVVRLAVGSVVGFILYRAFVPAPKTLGPLASGRRFLAWFCLFSQPVTFGRVILGSSANSFAEWFIVSVVFGSVVFLAGTVWGYVRGRSDRTSSVVLPSEHRPQANRQDLKSILDLRLANGENTLEEFRSLQNALGQSQSEVFRPSDASTIASRSAIHSYSESPEKGRVQPQTKPSGECSERVRASESTESKIPISAHSIPPQGSFARVQWDAKGDKQTKNNLGRTDGPDSVPPLANLAAATPEEHAESAPPPGSFARIQYDAKNLKSRR